MQFGEKTVVLGRRRSPLGWAVIAAGWLVVGIGSAATGGGALPGVAGLLGASMWSYLALREFRRRGAGGTKATHKREHLRWTATIADNRRG